MNESKNDSISKTLLVALLLCLVCSVVVAGSAVGLKSKQQQQKLLDKQRNILDVAGLLQPKMASKSETCSCQRIEPCPLYLNSGELLVNKTTTFDLAAALRNSNKSAALASNAAAIRPKSTWCVMNRVR